MITVFLLIVPLLFLFSIVYWSMRNGIAPTPTSGKQKDAILKAIPSKISGNIYELGSGWGTLTIAIAKHFPLCPTKGIENSPIPYAVSRILAQVYGLKNLQFVRANFLKFAFTDASLIICYLYPGGMKKMKPKLHELRPGTIVISNTFSIPGWQPVQTVQAQDLYRSPIYVYKK